MERGQTLIEVLIAFTIALLVVSAVTAAILTALTGAQFTKTQNLAKQFAQQGVDTVRSWRDTNYGTFKTYAPSGNQTYCYAKTCTALTNNGTDTSCGYLTTTICPVNINNIYVRQVQFITGSTDCGGTPPSGPTKITVSVYWSDAKCPASNAYCHQVSESTCLSDVNILPSP